MSRIVHKTEVLIIGAGVVGCITAMKLSQLGVRVTIVDKGIIGGESSWAAGGVLFPLLPWDYSKEVNTLVMSGLTYYEKYAPMLLEETGIDPELCVSGMLIKQLDDLDKARMWCESYHISYQIVSNKSFLIPQVAQIRPPRLMQALRKWLYKHGVPVFEGIEMTPLPQTDGKLEIWKTTSNHSFQADKYIASCGAWSSLLLNDTNLNILPKRGQMLLYKDIPIKLSNMIFQKDFYLIPRQDGHLLAGSTVEDTGFDKQVTVEAAKLLHEKAIGILPELAGLSAVKQWSGLRPSSPGNIPIIKRHESVNNLWINAGHFRYGIAMAPKSAEIIAGLLSSHS